jgi:hypothetical protein
VPGLALVGSSSCSRFLFEQGTGPVNGDSGGPIFSLAANNEVTAKGIISGISVRTDRPGVPFMAFIAIDWISSDFKVQVNSL